MFYYTVFSILALATLVRAFANSTAYRPLEFWLLAGGVVMFGGARYQVGADWDAYLHFYEETSLVFDPLIFTREYLFKSLVYIAGGVLGLDYCFFVLIIFTVAFGLKAWVIYKTSPSVPLAILIYYGTVFLYFDINGIRQGLALGFTMLAIFALLRKCPVGFYCCAAVAVLVHTSALVFLPLHILSKIRLKPVSVGVILVSAYLVRSHFSAMLERVGLLNSLLSVEELLRYNHYAADTHYGRMIGLLDLAMLQRVVVLLAFLCFYSKIKAADEYKRILLNAYFVSVLVFVLFSSAQEMAARLSFYYKVVDIIVLPMLVASVGGFFSRIVTISIVVFLVCLLMSRILAIPDNYLEPYQNMLMVFAFTG